jgi:hypothetical protein
MFKHNKRALIITIQNPKQLFVAIKLENLQQLCLYITDFKRHKVSCWLEGKKLWKKKRLKASLSDKTSKRKHELWKKNS